MTSQRGRGKPFYTKKYKPKPSERQQTIKEICDWLRQPLLGVSVQPDRVAVADLIEKQFGGKCE